MHNGCDALLVWFELHAHGGASVSMRPHTLRNSSYPPIKVGKESSDGGDSSSSSSSAPASTSFGLGLYYLDAPLTAAPAAQQQQKPQQQAPGSMAAGQDMVITTQVQEQLRLQFSITAAAPAGTPSEWHGSSSSSNNCECSYTWSPHGVPRHAMLPRWHFDMLGDEARNSAYDAAIRCGSATVEDPIVLNAGSPVHLMHMRRLPGTEVAPTLPSQWPVTGGAMGGQPGQRFTVLIAAHFAMSPRRRGYGCGSGDLHWLCAACTAGCRLPQHAVERHFTVYWAATGLDVAV
jgi:hypothetical protein